eukprot:CCRYP_013060-RA/>CCRYP_013060-RA protein AED:0.39 eAED:0.55 QI:0/0/0/1/0/0/3/0/78
MNKELPTGIKTKHRNSKDNILKLLASLYGQRQDGFQQSLIDECVFYRDDFISSSLMMLQDSGLNIEDEGLPANFIRGT